MMAGEQNAGSIVYEVSADVAPLLQGGRQASKALEQMESSLNRSVDQFKKLDTQVSATAKGVSGGLKGGFQQAGYQIQDFIVQVQGGQSALVAFSQQGSQLAGAFGPGGAVLGAVIALSTVIAGTLISSLNGGKSAIDSLKDAAEEMDKVITISQNGVAALTDGYANLARVNSQVATLLRNQALLEYNQAIAKIPKAISDASESFIGFGDKIKSALGGGYASIEGFNDRLAALNITTNNYSEASDQAGKAGMAFSATANAINNTVGALSSKLGISQQQAFGLAKELSDLSKNPSPQALQDLASKLQGMTSSSKEGQAAITELLGPIIKLAGISANAAFNVDRLKESTDNLTSSQKSLIAQSERNLALSKLQGEARARLQAQYAAEDAGFAKDDPHTKRMQDDAAATYTNTEAQRKLKAEQKKGASQAESIAQKLANLKQQSEVVADSTQQMTREQAILNAQQSLGKAATEKDIQLAGEYAAKKFDAATAIKAQAAAEKLLPESKENASYRQDQRDLLTALSAKKISIEQFNETAERLEEQHQVNLAKIRAQQVVSPTEQALGDIDPVQRLANQHAQELAMIQQFETQKGKLTQRGLELMNAANTQYEQQRIAAQWEIFRNQNEGYELAAAAFDSFAGNASNALTGILTGSMSVNEALASLGRTVLNSVINSFIQMGVEYAKNLILQQTLGSAAVAATSVQAAAAGAAWATPAALAATATLGGAAVAGSTALASTVAGAQALALAGARKNGGPVSAGSMYRVGEGGMPEIYQASTGKQYMIPGDNGRVISNKDMQAGNGMNVVVNFNDHSSGSHTYDYQATQDGNTLTVDAFIADMSNGGRMSQSIANYHNAPRRARGE